MKNKIPKAKNLQKIVIFLSIEVYLYINIIYTPSKLLFFVQTKQKAETVAFFSIFWSFAELLLYLHRNNDE